MVKAAGVAVLAGLEAGVTNSVYGLDLYYNVSLVLRSVYNDMKDLKNLLIYGALGGLMVLLLMLMGQSDAVSGGVKVTLALILVVVVPLVLGVYIGKKERRAQSE